eukprot:Protomagalhaensia_sp_Gyna_25__6010@NODE_942_length_2374_cov_29_269379_g748_i0_p2_GENE_NODE_942_length_2374_cov_29_269379_g748_i0NODE_942_length_2374_cov_29_269379_g748_i0_p2_ORF_typecomplete_len169_score17_47UPF0086/PF01868_16/3e19_NODE_942_length_2374_cov_29_269379_g748_i06361142
MAANPKVFGTSATRLWLTSTRIRGLGDSGGAASKLAGLAVPPKVHYEEKPAALSRCGISRLEDLWQQYAIAVIKNPIVLSRMELVGAKVSITKSANPCNILLSGVIIDETKSTFYIQNRQRRVLQIPKKGTHFKLEVGSRSFVVIGDGIERNVAARTKAKLKHVIDTL